MQLPIQSRSFLRIITETKQKKEKKERKERKENGTQGLG
jgi:hypothetical protein